jgi:hypothetical protein
VPYSHLWRRSSEYVWDGGVSGGVGVNRPDDIERLHQVIAVQILPVLRDLRDGIRSQLVLLWVMLFLVGISISVHGLILWVILDG